jgi:hypothetical protein
MQYNSANAIPPHPAKTSRVFSFFIPFPSSHGLFSLLVSSSFSLALPFPFPLPFPLPWVEITERHVYEKLVSYYERKIRCFESKLVYLRGQVFVFQPRSDDVQ